MIENKNGFYLRVRGCFLYLIVVHSTKKVKNLCDVYGMGLLSVTALHKTHENSQKIYLRCLVA